MIKPTKYTNIDFSVIGLSYEVIKLFKVEKIQKYNQMFNKILSIRGKAAKENILLALSFLFLLGKIKYHKNGDIIEYVS